MHKTFFVHVPSSAGSTIWYVLKRAYKADGTYRRLPKRRDTFNAIMADPKRRLSFGALGGHVNLAQARELAPEFKTFCFVRDPVARMRSGYARKVRHGEWTATEDTTGADILRFAAGPRRRRIFEYYLGPKPMPAEFNLDAIAKHIEENLDIMCLTEDFDRSLFLLKDRLGWPEVPNYIRKNRDGTGKGAMSEEVRGELRELLAPEYELYEHCKALFQQQLEASGAAPSEAELEAYRAGNAAKEKRVTLLNFGRNPFVKTGKKG